MSEPVTASTIAGAFDEVATKKFDRAVKLITNTGIATAIVMVLLWYVLLPWMDYFREESRLNNEANRVNNAKIVQALSETSAANAKLSNSNEVFSRSYEKQVELNERQIETNDRTNILLKEIRDDQRKGAWRDMPEKAKTAKVSE